MITDDKRDLSQLPYITFVKFTSGHVLPSARYNFRNSSDLQDLCNHKNTPGVCNITFHALLSAVLISARQCFGGSVRNFVHICSALYEFLQLQADSFGTPISDAG